MAMGIKNLTPFTFQADIMNGVDPAPQDIALENSFFAQHKVRLFAYNQQVDRLPHHLDPGQCAPGRSAGGRRLRDHATPGYSYQSWMLAEVNAIEQGGGQQDLDPEAVMTDHTRAAATPEILAR